MQAVLEQQVPAVQWFVVPATAALLSGRPVLVCALAVALWALWAVAQLWVLPLSAAADSRQQLLWPLMERALYVGAALLVAFPAVLAYGYRVRALKGARVHGVGAGASWYALGDSWRQLLLALAAVSVCFLPALWTERAPPPWIDGRWGAPVGRLSSLMLFIAVALTVRHIRALDAPVTTLWIGSGVLVVLVPGGAVGALLAVAVAVVAFLAVPSLAGWAVF